MATIHRARPGQYTPIIACVARKGGVGKTLLSLELGTYFALRNKSVLIVECDDNIKLFRKLFAPNDAPYDSYEETLPLDQTSYALYYPERYDLGRAAFTLDLEQCFARTNINKEPLARIREEQHWTQPNRLDIIVGTRRLRDIDDEFARAQRDAAEQGQVFNTMTRFKTGISSLRDFYDVIIVDTPPSLTRVQNNVVFAADHVIVLGELFPSSVLDMRETEHTINEVRSAQRRLSQPPVATMGFVVTRYEGTEGQQEVLARYTQPHRDQRGQARDPLLAYPLLGTIPLNSVTIDAAERQRVPAMIAAPKGLGMSLFAIGQTVERRLWGGAV